jgi:hypothetical protein
MLDYILALKGTLKKVEKYEYGLYNNYYYADANFLRVIIIL